MPGVGSYDYGVKSLKDLCLTEVIKDKVLKRQTPILGICLGMQLLTKGSEEGSLEGFGFIEGYTNKFSSALFDRNLKVPHMGWNYVQQKNISPILANLENDSRFYFVHSYHVVCENPINSIAVTNYGYEFTCIIQKVMSLEFNFIQKRAINTGLTY